MNSAIVILLSITQVLLVINFDLETSSVIERLIFVAILCVMASTITALLNMADEFWKVFRVWAAGCLGGWLCECVTMLILKMAVGKSTLLSVFISLAISQIVMGIQKAGKKIADKKLGDILGGED